MDVKAKLFQFEYAKIGINHSINRLPFDDFDKFQYYAEVIHGILYGRPLLQLAVFNLLTDNSISHDAARYIEIHENEFGFLCEHGYVGKELTVGFDYFECYELYMSKRVFKHFYQIMRGKTSESFIMKFNKVYDVPFDLKQLDFWENVLKVKVPLLSNP
ncbi:hypothetical protein [Tamlana flava]|uniref:hypothetical protein n=1 Tax=Tamlana flava TaxID=3158572 RepID=UPI00351B7EFD